MPKTTISGTLRDAAGTPMWGYVTFTPDTSIVNVTGPDGSTIPRVPARADLDAAGKFIAELQPANGAGVNPQDFTYRAALHVAPQGKHPGRPVEFSFTALEGASVQLEEITPVTGNDGIPHVLGPQGPQGVQGPQGIAGPQGMQGPQGLKGDTGNTGPQGVQGPQGLKGDTGNTGPQGIQGATGPTGAKGDPGGFVSTPLPANTDLDTITAEGLYRVIASLTAPEAATAHLPFNEAGSLSVTLSQTGTTQIQVYTTNTKGIYARRRFGGSWGPWRHFGSSRVDTTAGRVMYQWDEANNREQTVYADTGWRNITTDLANGWTGSVVSVRRYGATVFLRMYQVNGTAQTANTILTLPAGFRSGTFQYEPIYTESSQLSTVLVESTGNIKAAGSNTKYGTAAYAEIQWSTTESWPTILPGVASGSIPT